MVRDSIKIAKTNNSKVYTGWRQNWTSAKAVQRDRYIDIQEIVRGPFSSPRLLQTQPIVTVSSCQQETANVRENCNIRRGIPDAWREYLAIKGLCGTKEACLLQTNLIPSCVRCFATDRLWNDLGLPLIQGIPDPWKNSCIKQAPSSKCIRQRHSRGKNIYIEAANVYDGDDEEEAGVNLRYRCNKNYVEKKAQGVQYQPNFSMNGEREAVRMYTRNWDEANRRARCRKERNIDLENCQGTNTNDSIKKSVRNKYTHQDIDGLTSKNLKYDKTTVRKKIQTDMIKKTNEAIQTCVADREKKKCVKGDKIQSSRIPAQKLDTCNEKVPNRACCNCLLRNHTHSNVQYVQGGNQSNCVLCKECENLYCAGKPRKACTKQKKVKCTSSTKRRSKPKKTSKCLKYKLCACLRKSKPRVSTRNKSTNCHMETKSTVCNNEELKLMCCRCNSPYLKIESIQMNDTVQQSSLCICKKPSIKFESKQTKTEDHVTKYSTARMRRNMARCSEKINCTCTENKRYIPRHDLERSSHLMTVKWGNGLVEKSHATLDDNNLDDVLNKKIQKTNLNKVTNVQHKTPMGIHNGVQSEKMIKLKRKGDLHSRQFIDCRTMGTTCKKSDTENGCCGNTKRNGGEVSIRNVKFNVGEFSNLKCDRNALNSVSDSEQYADISDNVANVGFNVMAHDELSVTSVTLIRRLDDAISAKRIGHATKQKSCNVLPETCTVKSKKRYTEIKDNMIDKKYEYLFE